MFFIINLIPFFLHRFFYQILCLCDLRGQSITILIIVSMSLIFFAIIRTLTPVILDANYISLKNQVIKAERRLLKELGFCCHVKHPHKVMRAPCVVVTVVCN